MPASFGQIGDTDQRVVGCIRWPGCDQGGGVRPSNPPLLALVLEEALRTTVKEGPSLQRPPEIDIRVTSATQGYDDCGISAWSFPCGSRVTAATVAMYWSHMCSGSRQAPVTARSVSARTTDRVCRRNGVSSLHREVLRAIQDGCNTGEYKSESYVSFSKFFHACFSTSLYLSSRFLSLK